MNDQHRVFQIGVVAFQVCGHVVAVAGIVGHHEQDGFLAQFFVFGIRLPPLDHAQVNVVGVFLGVLGALALYQFGAAGGVGQHGMLDHVLRNGFHQRVIRHGLHENRAVVVFGGGSHVHLQGEGSPFLLQPVVDVFDGFEPGHALVVNVVRLVVQHHQFVNVAHDHTQVHFGVGGRAGGMLAQKIVHRVLVIGRCGDVVAGIDAVDVGQENVAGGAGDAHLVLPMQGQLKVVAPVAPVHAVVWNDRVLKENAQPLKISVNAVQHDDVGGDHQKVARQPRLGLVQFVVETPSQHQAEHLGLAGAGRHLDHKAPPGLVKHAGGDRAGTVKAHQVVLVLHPHYIVQIDDCL